MNQISIFFLAAFLSAICADAQENQVLNPAHKKEPDNLVFVEGGTFKNLKATNYFGRRITVSSFFIGQFEVTQKEWATVMSNNPSHFTGDNLPVEMVSWYDCIEYCNQRSLNEGLKPYYSLDKNRQDPNNKIDPSFGIELDTNKWTVTILGGNGYRLPTEAEWEYAASGGQLSKGYTYSGGNDADQVAWYYQNAGDSQLSPMWNRRILAGNRNRTHPVGGKQPNELGLYDLSGNVREWCWDWHGIVATNVIDPKGAESGYFRVWRGGGWMTADQFCASSFRGNNNPANYPANDLGLRVCRSK